MRLKPPVTTQEALAWLKAEAAATWDIEDTPELDPLLLPTAEAMAAVSAAPIPEDVEPLLI